MISTMNYNIYEDLTTLELVQMLEFQQTHQVRSDVVAELRKRINEQYLDDFIRNNRLIAGLTSSQTIG
jgi:hypothetical protein